MKSPRFTIGLCVAWIFVSVVSADTKAVVSVVQKESQNHDRTDQSGDVQPTKIFKPEKHWKKVQPDEAIPKGLHVRINMQTGEKEAKLLDETENSADSRKLTPEQLKVYVKNVKNEADKLKETDTSQFRDMDTIRKEFEELDLKPVKSDSHTIQELLSMFRSESSSSGDRMQQLKEMEYLLHQYDVAKDFVKMGGIRELLVSLNDSHIRDNAALALGAALQGNPEVQRAALASQGIHSLLVSLNEGCSSHCVLALSALLRQFPKAQTAFLSEGGPQILSKTFRDSGSNEKTKVKIITLLGDLLVEGHHAKSGKEGDVLRSAYSKVILGPSVVDAGFCELISASLSSRNEDVREKVLNALHSLIDYCKFDLLVPQLESLRIHYKTRMFEDDPKQADEYFETLYKLTDDLVKHITDESHQHMEL
ncbi:nucleotide exchange factor SIL1 [Galendromus occidentalis]|uniref:Nucleotide exchange factor SIL1 n=1 Tax=Galendromus occidentalis TaxID=34638 RepID=A0AAJ6VY86_9ACAR|nr:nucleotide exchange factor SIL1 [Galendromus occidentalis]